MCNGCEQLGVLGRGAGGILACPWQGGVRAGVLGLRWRRNFRPSGSVYLCLGAVRTRSRRNTGSTTMCPTGVRAGSPGRESGRGVRAGVRAQWGWLLFVVTNKMYPMATAPQAPPPAPKAPGRGSGQGVRAGVRAQLGGGFCLFSKQSTRWPQKDSSAISATSRPTGSVQGV